MQALHWSNTLLLGEIEFFVTFCNVSAKKKTAAVKPIHNKIKNTHLALAMKDQQFAVAWFSTDPRLFRD